MILRKAYDVTPQEISTDKVRGVRKRVLIGLKNAPNFVMRLFTVEPGGLIDRHDHPWEHEIFVLKGKLTVLKEQGEETAEEGFCIFVGPNEIHGFRNDTDSEVEFLCLIPKEGGE
ncbi:Cupin 2 conserved barrel domain protein [Thermotoga sp. Mc24]|uniref:cupin domain-containing protein n=1 Tax=Thermotoga sp. Mc24 TaxID=1231241 RepID=UPI0005426B85|nr:cupin domain-containing protein [Thermotoga sp. Mc24]KHC91291.1 Cupin 2 conserved barrel domain protein [Thermotoga sp. Mc24]